MRIRNCVLESLIGNPEHREGVNETGILRLALDLRDAREKVKELELTVAVLQIEAGSV